MSDKRDLAFADAHKTFAEPFLLHLFHDLGVDLADRGSGHEMVSGKSLHILTEILRIQNVLGNGTLGTGPINLCLICMIPLHNEAAVNGKGRALLPELVTAAHERSSRMNTAQSQRTVK